MGFPAAGPACGELFKGTNAGSAGAWSILSAQVL